MTHSVAAPPAIANRARRLHFGTMTAHRPTPAKPFIKPAYWTNEPAPAPQAVATPPADDKGAPSPTRYGDWVKNGIAIDF